MTNLQPRDALDEDLVRLLGMATRGMVWSWDARTNRVLHNDAVAERFGALPSSGEAAAAWWRERVHPADGERVTEAFARARRERAPCISFEYRLRDQRGGYADIEDRACFLHDAAGRFIGVLGAAQDVTHSKHSLEDQARLAHILESTSDLVATASAGGLISQVNAAGRRMLGWGAEETGQGVHLATMHPEWAAEIVFEEAVPTAIRQGTWTGETALVTRDGREIPVSQVVISHLDENGSLKHLSMIIRDLRDRKREEVARIEWANRYDAVIRASGQVVYDWNSATNEIVYSGDLPRLLGYSATEMAGGLDRFRNLILPEDLPAFDQEIQRVVATRDPFQLSYRMRHRDGRRIFVEDKGYFFLDRKGQIGRMIGFLTDVTPQHEAQLQLAVAHDSLEARVAARTAELARANRVIEERAMQQSVVARLGQRALAGAPLSELLANAVELVRTTLRVSFCVVFQLSEDGAELISSATAGDFCPQASVAGLGYESQPGYTLLLRQPVIVEDVAAETRFQLCHVVRESGARSSVSVAIESGGEPVGVLLALTLEHRTFTEDDTHFLQAIANVLTAAIDHYRGEEQIRHAQAEAEAANRAKSEMLSRMSHELRTPLNAILGFSQLLEADMPTESQAESLSHIVRAGQHLLSLINEVLDIAGLDSGRLQLTTEGVDLPTFLRETTGLVRAFAAGHEIDLQVDASCDADAEVVADRQRLREVVLNLLTNAVKFNHPGGRVVVSCVERAERVRISVSDTGPGIPEDRLERLFVPFERLGAESLGVQGTGIGLALSKRIMVALGGALGVETTSGKGSTFWIEVPLMALEAAPPQPLGESFPAPPSPPRKLLYVEDQDFNQQLVKRILVHRPGYTVIPSPEGSRAVALAREHQPDLILLDLNLPGLPGDEILRQLKADPDLRAIPVIMISADAIGSRVEQLLELGATEYVTKPYKVREFLECIDRVMPEAGIGQSVFT